MRLLIGLFVISAVAIGGAWAWLGAAELPPGGLMARGDKLYCVSYAPFRHNQTPFDLSTRIEPAQIEEDIAKLASLTGCVRTYSTDFGLNRIPEIAQRHGLKVIQGLWLSGVAAKNQIQIETAVALANKYPDTIRAVVVGNEVLLRGEMSARDLAAIIRDVKARVPVPVTYADVWEFWLQNAALAGAVDFVTVHILPYWEDFPIPAATAAAHVDSIRRRVAAAFPGKDIMIGEFGWPSQGRMREGALPSPINQAKVIQEVLTLAKRENYRVNVIEAFDQPWKRALEGTVGGHWGLFDDAQRTMKFAPGEPVSNHPHWQWQAAGGVFFAALIFLAALRSRRDEITPAIAIAVALIAIIAGITFGWTVETIPRESYGVGGSMRMLALGMVALLAPLLAASALTSSRPLPSFSQILAGTKTVEPLALALGGVLIAVTVLAIMVALTLTFDPRYRDFPFAALSGAVIPYLLMSFFGARPMGARAAAEIAAAVLLALCTFYIAVNESLANWQSLWLCGLLVALAVTLGRARAAPSSV